MGSVQGNHDGYTFQGDWSRAGADRVTWTAVVRNSEGRVGTPNGRIHAAGGSDSQIDEIVRLAILTAIEGGVGVDRSLDN
jgi:hypothetical protein